MNVIAIRRYFLFLEPVVGYWVLYTVHYSQYDSALSLWYIVLFSKLIRVTSYSIFVCIWKNQLYKLTAIKNEIALTMTIKWIAGSWFWTMLKLDYCQHCTECLTSDHFAIFTIFYNCKSVEMKFDIQHTDTLDW